MTAPETLYRTPNNVYGFRKCCEAIRDNVPIEEVARRYTHLEPFGGNAWFVGHCALPDHEDKTPSFTSTHPADIIATGVVEVATWWIWNSTAATTANSGKR